ncbi:hypothetical protein EJB05_11051, partial [Eragrostis curvula]
MDSILTLPRRFSLCSGRRQASSRASRIPSTCTPAAAKPPCVGVASPFPLPSSARRLPTLRCSCSYGMVGEPDAAGHSYSLRPVRHYVSPSGATVAHGYCTFQAEGIS